MRKPPEKDLDVKVATRLMGYRWVVWNRKALRGSPLYTPGRFLAPPDHLSAHLTEPADASTPVHAQPLAKVPRWSEDMERAFAVAETVGLFSKAKAVLLRGDGGEWTVEFRGSRLTCRDLAELLCRASLEWHDAVASDPGRGGGVGAA